LPVRILFHSDSDQRFWLRVFRKRFAGNTSLQLNASQKTHAKKLLEFPGYNVSPGMDAAQKNYSTHLNLRRSTTHIKKLRTAI
jgi:hypothetical protein